MENLIILAAIAFGGWCTAIASKSHPNRSFSRNLVFQPARFLFPLRLPCEVSRLSRLIQPVLTPGSAEGTALAFSPGLLPFNPHFPDRLPRFGTRFALRP